MHALQSVNIRRSLQQTSGLSMTTNCDRLPYVCITCSSAETASASTRGQARSHAGVQGIFNSQNYCFRKGLLTVTAGFIFALLAAGKTSISEARP